MENQQEFEQVFEEVFAISRSEQTMFQTEIIEDYCDEKHRKGTFRLEPITPSCGLIVGNSLRRILLSSLRGAVAVAIRIVGVRHEFQHVPNVLEDVSTLILNIKKMRFRVESDKLYKATIRLQHQSDDQPLEIRAGHVDFESADEGGIEILNPEHYLATLDNGGTFEMELYIKSGIGYTPADENKQLELKNTDVIAIDSIYRPVEQVQYTVETIDHGPYIGKERVVLTLEGDGNIHPRDAIAYSAKILKDQMVAFLKYEHENRTVVEETKGEEVDEFTEHLNKSVDELDLSVRSQNCLNNANIKYIGQLVQKSENDMLRTKNFGRKSLKELKELLSDLKLQLGMKLDSWTVPEQKS
jgi:DNA-directed RNA polymerase subunit alpha